MLNAIVIRDTYSIKQKRNAKVTCHLPANAIEISLQILTNARINHAHSEEIARIQLDHSLAVVNEDKYSKNRSAKV